jgi:putative SOS response-associated peptidase YedK
MCGRYDFSRKEFSDLRIRWNLDEEFPLLKPRYNIAPNQDAPVIINAGGEKSVELLQWGLVPLWAKEPAFGNRMINARSEGLTEKASFRSLLERRRCLVPACGFYEWRKEGKEKVAMRFKLRSGEPFVFAGLWDFWRKPDGKFLNTFTIVTTEPNDLLRPIHDRMPVMLNDDGALKWLSGDGKVSDALSLLTPYPSEEMESYEVSRLVNDPRNDSPACIEPSGMSPSQPLLI